MTQPPAVPSTMSQLKETLRLHDMRARKSMGQHFLVDRNILRSIAEAAELTDDDSVIEVGPGTGLLTTELCTRAGEVIAVELDRRMVALLRESLAGAVNLHVVEGDILTLPPDELLERYGTRHPDRYKVVANLPYYITSPVLRHFVHAVRRPELMVVMVQEEVGRAITAKPGDMSLLSVSIQAFARPKAVRKVSARSFHPPPKVDSMVLRLDVTESAPVHTGEIDGFLDFVGAGFHSPRKQLRNSFGHGLRASRSRVDELLSSADIAPERRPETLTVDEWVRLWTKHIAMPPEEHAQC